MGIATTSLTAPGTDKLTPLGPCSCQFYVDRGIKAELTISTWVERGSHPLHPGESLLCQRPMHHPRCQPSKENVFESRFARSLYMFSTRLAPQSETGALPRLPPAPSPARAAGPGGREGGRDRGRRPPPGLPRGCGGGRGRAAGPGRSAHSGAFPPQRREEAAGRAGRGSARRRLIPFFSLQIFQWRQLENLYFREKKFSVEVHDPRR